MTSGVSDSEGRRWRAGWWLLALAFGLTVRADPTAELASCEERFAAAPEAAESAECFFLVAYRHGLHEEAARRLERHRRARPGNPWLLLNLGKIALELNRPSAGEPLREAARILAERGEAEGEARARANLAELLTRRGRLAEAGPELDRAVALAETLAQPELTAALRLRIAKHRSGLGELDEAYGMLRSIESEAAAGGSPRTRMDALKMLGVVAQQLGRATEAEEYYSRLIGLAEELSDLPQASRAWYNLLTLRLEQLPTDAARTEIDELARRALTVAREARDRVAEAQVLSILGQLSEGEAGNRHLERCLELSRPTGDARHVSLCLAGLAYQLREEDPATARGLMKEAMESLLSSESPWAVAYLWHELMAVSWATLPAQEAYRESSIFLDAIEALRDLPEADEYRATLFTAWTDAYLTLSGHLLRKADEWDEALDRAFEVTERMRARVLLEVLDKPHRSAAPDFATLVEVRESLAHDQAVLSFQVGLAEDVFGRFSGGAWLLAITRDGTRVHQLPDRLAIETRLPLFLGLFERRDGLEKKPAASLYRELLAEAVAALPSGIDRLILVPDGVLHLLPFAALVSEKDAEPLAADYRITEAPSATLWKRWRRADVRPYDAPVLAVADPAVPWAEGVARRRTSEPGAGAGRLPHARQEGRRLLRLVGGRSRLLLDAEASEHAVKALDLGGFAVLHLAAHAVVDERRPQRSFILLAPEAGEDGLLYLDEIAGLDLAGRLVVLSACRSAAGTVLSGEGVMSLARGFFEAGARTVLGSLWPLRDDDAADFFDRFYRHLTAGRDVAEAVGEAQAEMRRAGAPAAAWAGIVVLGDGALAPFPGGVETIDGKTVAARTAALAAVGLAAVLLVAMLLLRRRQALS